jgi:hypothetical protein
MDAQGKDQHMHFLFETTTDPATRRQYAAIDLAALEASIDITERTLKATLR